MLAAFRAQNHRTYFQIIVIGFRRRRSGFERVSITVGICSGKTRRKLQNALDKAKIVLNSLLNGAQLPRTTSSCRFVHAL
jgi:hypothetical protein